MIAILQAVYALGGLVALLVVAALHVAVIVRSRRRHKKALSYLRRAEDGTIYAIDPQSPGTLHRLDEQLTKRILGDLPKATPRQARKVRRRVNQLLGAR